MWFSDFANYLRTKIFVVIQRLLDWIDRCDIAMQSGLPKPPFQTITGESIFPDSDEPWWLTELSKRVPVETTELGDEDGPLTGDEKEREEVTDEDATSNDDAAPHNEGISTSTSDRWTPFQARQLFP